MEQKTNPAWEHIKLLIWVILIFEIFLGIIALVVMRVSDDPSMLYVLLGIGALLALVFMAIFFLNLLEIMIRLGFKKGRLRLGRKKPQGLH